MNVTVEGPAKIMGPIAESGRVYIKWFSFRTRQLDVVASCYRCYGTDHRVKDCRRKAEVCKRCGQDGHRAMQCSELPGLRLQRQASGAFDAVGIVPYLCNDGRSGGC